MESVRHGVLRTKLATDRFEHRVTEESTRVIRWMFGFFVAYLGVTLSLVGMILHAK